MSSEVLHIAGRAIAVQYAPEMDLRGYVYNPESDQPVIALREPDERVLLHELLHVVLARALPWFRGQPDWTSADHTLVDPNEQVTQWLEEFLWDAGYRRTTPTTRTPEESPDE